MSDIDEEGLSRLDTLRFTRRVVERQAREQLDQIDRWIAAEQRREDAQRRAAHPGPDPSPWLLARDAGGTPQTLHQGGFWCVEERSSRVFAVTREEARQALAEGIKACAICRPDTALGFTS